MDGIVLLAKQPGPTSFSSLHDVKRAFNTRKVGHTGTLDSFAQGLLVVCTGRLTRLSGYITQFNKTYKAVIKFGEETDTLEPEGNIIKKAPLPKKDLVINAINSFLGEQEQYPPSFSAIHVDGKRASDLVRNGEKVEIPPRKITVFKSRIIDFDCTPENFVKSVLVEFEVSKGTYIRSLARDIGKKANSAAHLLGLYRTQIGSFKVEDSAGYDFLKPFTIKNVYSQEKINFKQFKLDEALQDEIRNKIKFVDKNFSKNCGFINLDLVDNSACDDFKNGRPIRNKSYIQNLYEIPVDKKCAVFFDNIFAGLLDKDSTGKLRYDFVIN